MYWIYLVTLTFAIFVPTYVRHGFLALNLAQTQELVLLMFGSIGFALFLIQEKMLNKSHIEKSSAQRQVNLMAKDLRHSYSYIGEINRKLDILEGISLSYPESSNLTKKNESELYDVIMSAIELFGKSSEFALRFINLATRERLMEINCLPQCPINFSFKEYNEHTHYFEFDEHIAITSPRAIDSIFACIVIKKKTAGQQIEDKEIMKALASQALFLFMLMRHKKQIACVI